MSYQDFLDAGFDRKSALRAAMIQSSAPQPPRAAPQKTLPQRFFAWLNALKGE